MSGIGRGRTVAAAGAAAAVALGVVLVAAAAPVAAADNATFKLPAHIIIETNPIPEPEYPSACAGYVFAEFPHIRGAVSYAVTLDDTQFWYDGTKAGAPPFADDDFRYGDSRWVAPAGSHRFALSGGSTSSGGCEQVILGLEGRWMITDAKVSMSETFTERWEKRKKTCYFKNLTRVPRNVPIIMPRRDRFAVRVFGEQAAFTIIDGQPYRIWNRTFLAGPTTLKVGRRTIVTIAPLRSPLLGGEPFQKVPAGETIVIGPGTKVQLTPGKPIKVLETTPGVDFRNVPDHQQVVIIKAPSGPNTCVIGGPSGARG